MPLEDFDRVITDLQAIPREVRTELTPVLKRAGESVAADARARASWSTRIPGAVALSVRYGQRRTGVLLRVSAARAPHARAYEGLGRPGNFRHPRFGDRDAEWVTQARRPYAWPAVVAHRAETDHDVAGVVDAAARRHGFH